MNTTVPHNTPSARAVVSSKAGGMTQGDLFAPAVIANPTPPATPPAKSVRRLWPYEAAGLSYDTTSNIPTLVVDGIKNLTYHVQ